VFVKNDCIKTKLIVPFCKLLFYVFSLIYVVDIEIVVGKSGFYLF